MMKRFSRHIFPAAAVLIGALLSMTSTPPAARAQTTPSPWAYNMEVVSSLKIDTMTKVLLLDGNRVYLGGNLEPDGYYKLIIIDVSDPRNPRKLGEYIGKGYLFDLAIRDSVLYVANYLKPMDLLDVSNPSHIQWLKELGKSPNNKVIVQNDVLYMNQLAKENAYLYAYDIRDAKNPRLISKSKFNVYRYDIRGVLLIADNVCVYDISNLSQYLPLGKSNYTSGFNDLFLSGAYALGWAGDGSIRIYDLFNPSTPAQIGVYHTFDNAAHGSLDFWQSLMFAGSKWGVQVFDISRPSNPDFVRGSYFLPSGAKGIAVRGSFVYACDEYNGLVILKYTGPVPEEKINNATMIKVAAPATLRPGQPGEATVTVRNTGLCGWNGYLGYKLAITSDPGGLSTFGTRLNIHKDQRVAAGKDFTFRLALKAPATAGTRTMKFQMVQEFGQFFGPTGEFTIKVAGEPWNAAGDWAFYR